MRHFIITLSALLFTVWLYAGDAGINGVKIENLRMGRSGDRMELVMTLDVSSLQMRGTSTVLLAPMLQGPGGTAELPVITLMGRRQYIYHRRNKRSDGNAVYLRNGAESQLIPYEAVIPYESWMDEAALFLTRFRSTCCRQFTAESMEKVQVPGLRKKKVNYAFMVPELGDAYRVKEQSVSGTAFIRFHTNRWDIQEGYQDNISELARIRNIIELILNNKDATITGIELKGFASPEAAWVHNAMLAENRTKSLKHYLLGLYAFDPDIIRVSYEAEDWEGVRAFVANGSLANKADILAIIDGDANPDQKEQLIKNRYPAQYQILYRDCYPSLRHTYYKIEYRIRTFLDEKDLEKAFEEKPENLSLDDLYYLAGTYETGSDAFNRVWEAAVKRFPEDPAANLNAANISLISGNYEKARAYLYHSGNSPEAMNARGLLAWFTGDMDTAARLFQNAAERGLQAAEDNAQSFF